MIPDLTMSGPYFNADGSPNAAGLQLLRVINAVKARTGGMVSEGVSEAEATATGGATQTLAEWFADVEAATSGLAAHIADTSDAHDASAISVTPAGTLAATDVQAGLVEILGDVEAHVADTSAAHAASAISYNGGTGMSATDVEAAIDELATEKLNASSYTAADVLSKLLTVDGAGSGLDADLLDGLSSGAFAQLAAANTFTANVTLGFTYPNLIWDAGSAGANEGVTYAEAVGSTWAIVVSSDDYMTTTNALSIQRTGSTLNSVTIGATLLNNAAALRIASSTETTGSLTSASANRRVVCSGNITLPSSGMTAGDFILIDPAGTARTVTRPAAHTMYIVDTDSATGTTRAHNVALAVYHGSSKWTLHGVA